MTSNQKSVVVRIAAEARKAGVEKGTDPFDLVLESLVPPKASEKSAPKALKRRVV